MTRSDHGKDRAGRRAKRFQTPTQKHEIWFSWSGRRKRSPGGRAAAGRSVDDHADTHRGQRTDLADNAHNLKKIRHHTAT